MGFGHKYRITILRKSLFSLKTVNSNIQDPRLQTLKAVLDTCPNLKYTKGSENNPKLKSGLYYDHRKLKTGTWVLSFYKNVMTEGNDFELAVDPIRLAWPDENPGPARRWLEAQKERLQHLESGIHSTQPPSAVRIGFKYKEALEFVSDLRKELALTRTSERWRLPEKSIAAHSLALTPTETPQQDNPTSHIEASDTQPSDIALRMLQTVKATCAQSGSQSVVVAKNKEWRFTDDEHFLSVVNALLDQARGRCSLSGVVLDMTGEKPELSPSLDRKRSDGHYEPGNLQIVARFINRWKSDMPDEDFLSLLKTVRGA